jgi:hypothetical protein
MSWFGASDSSSTQSTNLFGNSNNSGSSSIATMMGFQDEPACAKICPKLSMKQRYFLCYSQRVGP